MGERKLVRLHHLHLAYALTSALSFDGLPFLPDHFDFVHISWIGLGVPENEVRWKPDASLWC